MQKFAGRSVLELCQEDQPWQYAAIVESLSLWRAPGEHGKTGKTICAAALSCALGSASVAVGTVAAILGLGMRMYSYRYFCEVVVVVHVRVAPIQGGVCDFRLEPGFQPSLNVPYNRPRRPQPS